MSKAAVAASRPMFPLLGDVITGTRSLLRDTITGASSLVRGTNHLCSAYEHGCRGVEETTIAVVEISKIAAKQQQQRLLDQLQSTAEPAST